MAQSQIHATRIDYYATPRQAELLNDIAKLLDEPVESFLSDWLQRFIKGQIENPEIFGSLLAEAWKGQFSIGQVSTIGRKRFELTVNLSPTESAVFEILRSFLDRYYPTFFQNSVNNDVRATLEVFDEIVKGLSGDERQRLVKAWESTLTN